MHVWAWLARWSIYNVLITPFRAHQISSKTKFVFKPQYGTEKTEDRGWTMTSELHRLVICLHITFVMLNYSELYGYWKCTRTQVAVLFVNTSPASGGYTGHTLLFLPATFINYGLYSCYLMSVTVYSAIITHYKAVKTHLSRWWKPLRCLVSTKVDGTNIFHPFWWVITTTFLLC